MRPRYPLVNVYITIWKDPPFIGKLTINSHYQWLFWHNRRVLAIVAMTINQWAPMGSHGLPLNLQHSSTRVTVNVLSRPEQNTAQLTAGLKWPPDTSSAEICWDVPQISPDEPGIPWLMKIDENGSPQNLMKSGYWNGTHTQINSLGFSMFIDPWLTISGSLDSPIGLENR